MFRAVWVDAALATRRIQSPAEYFCPSIIMVSFVWNMFILLITCSRRPTCVADRKSGEGCGAYVQKTIIRMDDAIAARHEQLHQSICGSLQLMHHQ